MISKFSKKNINQWIYANRHGDIFHLARGGDERASHRGPKLVSNIYYFHSNEMSTLAF